MSKHDRSITNTSSTPGAARGTKRSMNVQQALEWAFGKEKAELELEAFLRQHQVFLNTPI